MAYNKPIVRSDYHGSAMFPPYPFRDCRSEEEKHSIMARLRNEGLDMNGLPEGKLHAMARVRHEFWPDDPYSIKHSDYRKGEIAFDLEG